MTVAAVLLAAGRASRFAGGGKLLTDIGGEPLIARLARLLTQSSLRPVVAVIRPDDPGMARALAVPGVTLAETPDPEFRMGRSIAAGMAVLDGEAAGVMIVPGDMPGLTRDVLDRLISSFEEAGHRRIVYPALAGGQQRNPVVWPRRLFERLLSLDGQGGGKALLAEFAGETVAVQFTEEAPFADIDTREDLARYLERCRDR